MQSFNRENGACGSPKLKPFLALVPILLSLTAFIDKFEKKLTILPSLLKRNHENTGDKKGEMVIFHY